MIRLTDEQWERIRDHFPEENIVDGRHVDPRSEDAQGDVLQDAGRGPDFADSAESELFRRFATCGFQKFHQSDSRG